MTDIHIRIVGHVGRITLTRPQALNAMTYEMCVAIEQAFDDWRNNDAVQIVVLDAEGDRAFCSGGDIAELYDTGTKGDFAYGQKFWADEYRLNAKIFTYPKPVVSFLQGFTMGGGVGIGCHGSTRVVGDSSQVAMPECGIGLVPDVGGSLMLALAPGRMGEYLGITATRMNAEDALHAGFADIYLPEDTWPDHIAALENSADESALRAAGQTPPQGTLKANAAQIDRLFTGETLSDIVTDLGNETSDFASDALKKIRRNSPLSMACAIESVHRLRLMETTLSIEKALDLEYRYTFRAMEHGDFLEGIRAQIIDKDRNPAWQYPDLQVPIVKVTQMLQPLGANALKLKGEPA